MLEKRAIRLKRTPFQSVSRWAVITGAFVLLGAMMIVDSFRKKDDEEA